MSKIKQLLDGDPTDWREVTKYSKALVIASQHQWKHGESAALLDLMPYSNCNEDWLVQNYVDSVPLRQISKKRRECPVAASVLFRNGGPEVTNEANRKAIREYEKQKADAAAKKAANKLQRTQNRVKKRQTAVLQVTSMAVQQVLSSQTPPIEYRDESGEVVLRKFKPDSQSCKKFMEVCFIYTCCVVNHQPSTTTIHHHCYINM